MDCFGDGEHSDGGIRLILRLGKVVGLSFPEIHIRLAGSKTQTSPTITLLRVTVVAEVCTVPTKGPPASSGRRFTSHLPASSAWVTAVWPSMVTVTDCLGSAVPKNGAAALRCRTILSEKSGESLRVC